jgi:hypothetical protein
MAVPVPTHRSEIWTITKQKQKRAKTETAELKCFRSVAGYARKDQIRNTTIKEDLNIFNLNNTILKTRSQWKILTYNPKRRRNTGRPQLRWRDQHNFQEDGTGPAWPNP